MTLRLPLSSLLILALASPATLPAQSTGPRFGVGLSAGSLGLSGEVLVGLASRIEARGQLNYWKITVTDKTISDVTYDVEAKWASGAVLLDLYLAGPLRVSGGGVWNGNRLTVDADPTISVPFGDTTYTATDIGTINGTIDFRRMSPYLGIGFAGRGKVSPVFQLGVVLQGTPQVSYTATTTLTGAARTRFEQEVEAEVAAIEDALGIFKFYPHVSLGLTIRL
jgi:hypothetical protein